MRKPKFVLALEEAYREALEVDAVSIHDTTSKSGPRHLELHMSSAPYCPVRHFYSICQENPVSPLRTMPYSMAFYVGVGTAVHTAIQAAMAQGRTVYGNWKCHACGHFKHLSKSPVCPKCKHEHMEYVELPLRVGRRIVGQTDGVFDHKGKYYVIDYKTSSLRSIDWHRRTKKGFPYRHNLSRFSNTVS